MEKMKVYTQDEVLDMTLGKPGTTIRDEYDAQVIDYLNRLPNASTLAAMKEAESGALRNVPALDLSSIEAIEKTMGI